MFDVSRFHTKSCIVVAGPRASGKTTLVRHLLTHLNSDTAGAEIPTPVILCTSRPGAHTEYTGLVSRSTTLDEEDWSAWTSHKPAMLILEDDALSKKTQEGILASLLRRIDGELSGAVKVFVVVQYLPVLKRMLPRGNNCLVLTSGNMIGVQPAKSSDAVNQLWQLANKDSASRVALVAEDTAFDFDPLPDFLTFSWTC
jgi:Cdc6-like AAA superfamily ATPase